EYSRHECTAPERSLALYIPAGITDAGYNNTPAGYRCHVIKQKEQQKNGDCVEQDVREMMTACFQSKQLTIEHVRDRCERMPVARVSVSERPRDAAQRQAACDDRIAVNVRFI